jgi:hypothetical protein
VLLVLETESVPLFVIVHQDILNKTPPLVQFVTTNVVNVKDLPLIVLLVVLLELQPQVVHVQLTIMNFLTKPVLNVTTIVKNVLVTPEIVMNVGLHKIPIIET